LKGRRQLLRRDIKPQSDDTPRKGQQDGLDHKLRQNGWPACAKRHSQSDFAWRSVTLTSIMFMMPTPPTSRLMKQSRQDPGKYVDELVANLCEIIGVVLKSSSAALRLRRCRMTVATWLFASPGLRPLRVD
jgi:hypothetical protein